MFFACSADNGYETINATMATKDKKYCCWACGKPVVLKKGLIRKPYFSHLPKESCGDNWTHPAKTKWHILMQELFKTVEVGMEDEETGKRHFADAVWKDIVFEFQHSSISPKEVFERTLFYIQQGYRVVWVLDATSAFRKLQIQADWEYADLFSWKRAPRWFDYTPFLEVPDLVQVVLYWENIEIVDSEKRPFKYHDVGYLHPIIWTNKVYELSESRYRPDLSLFAVSNEIPLNSVADSEDAFCKNLFDPTCNDAKRYEYIANTRFNKGGRYYEHMEWI